MMHIHASRLPMVAACPSSYTHGEMIQGILEEEEFAHEETTEEESRNAAARGSRLHAVIASGNIPDDLSDQDRLEVSRAVNYIGECTRKLALKANCDPKDIRVMFEVHMRSSFGSVMLEGTADVILYEPRSKLCIILDWKFLNLDLPFDNYIAQCEGYMFLASHMLEVEGIEAVVVNCRTAKAIRRSIEEGQIDAFTAETQLQLQILDSNVSRPNPPIMPGPWQCKYCPRRGVCPALRQEVELAVQKSRSWALQSDEDALYWAEQAELAMSMAKAVRDNVEAYVLSRGNNVKGLKVQTVCGYWKADDIEEIYKRVSDVIPYEEFKSMMRLSVAKLRDEWVKRSGERFGWKKREATDGFFRLLEGTVSRDKGFFKLKRIS